MYHPPAFEPTRDEMMSILEKHIPFLNRMELVPIWEADGRTVSEDLTAPYSLPVKTYDVIVVGAGHAGCEAALACARMG